MRVNLLTIESAPARGPRVLLLPVTMRCNARCQMCTIWQQEPTGMTPAFIDQTFADGELGGELEYLGITGGEPTTLPGFDEVARSAIGYCPRLRELTFNTNGFLTEKTASAVETLLATIEGRDVRLEVYVSLDGVGEVHDRVRGIGQAFRRTEQTLIRLKELLAGRTNTRLSINSVVCQGNAGATEETFRYARALDLPIHFSLVMRTDVCINSAASEREFEILPEQVPDLRRFFARLRALARVSGGPLERHYYDHLLGVLDGRPRELPCPFSEHQGCLIDPYGDVFPCGVSRSLWMGNVKQTPFRSIWYSATTWARLAAELPRFCRSCESNCFIHAAEELHA